MTLAARHLEARRPRKDRDVTWSRKYDADSNTITWYCWRRDSRRVLYVRSRTIYLDSAPYCVPDSIRLLHRELRDFVDTIDLALMEQA